MFIKVSKTMCLFICRTIRICIRILPNTLNPLFGTALVITDQSAHAIQPTSRFLLSPSISDIKNPSMTAAAASTAELVVVMRWLKLRFDSTAI